MTKQTVNQETEQASRKLGQGSLAAMARLGHKEIGQKLAAFPGEHHITEEPGTFNNPTYTEVGKQRGSVHGPEVEASKTDGPKQAMEGNKEVVQQNKSHEKNVKEPDLEPEME